MNCTKCQKRLITRTGFCHHCRTPQNLVVSEKYRLVGLLGKGGFGEVYLCQSVSLPNHYALKLFSPNVGGGWSDMEWKKWEERFIQEAQQMAELAQHSPHIVQVLDLGTDQYYGQFYLMELLYGYTLQAFLHHNKSLGLRKTVELTGQICAGLQEAHKRGIFHRDLKPENIFLTFSDTEHHTKILDFGLAKVVQDSAPNQNSALLGSPMYAAPEQFSLTGRIDARTDLYALGGIVYCMLAGEAPFAKHVGNNNALALAQCNEAPLPLRERCPALHIPEALEQIVLKALAKDPAHRHASVQEFWTELQPWFRTPDYAVHVRLQQEKNVLRETIANLETQQHSANQARVTLQQQITTLTNERDIARQDLHRTEDRLKQTEGHLKQLQDQLRHTEAELRKLHEQPIPIFRFPVVPPKPPLLDIPEEPEPSPPTKKSWGRFATASLLLILFGSVGLLLATGAWPQWGSQTQPVAPRKTDPPPRSTEIRKPESPPCYVDKTDPQPRSTLASHAKTDDGRQFIEQSKGLRCTKLVRIPKGSFLMGSPNSDTEAESDEKPQHRVKLTRDFVMGKTEVTQQEFKDVMGYNDSNHKNCPMCPVENVSWHEAVAYTHKLSLSMGLISSEDEGCFTCTGTGKDITCSLRDLYKNKKYYTCPGFRLPTEAEWEYGARGGNPAPRYGKLDDIAWYSGNSGNKTHPVCTKTTTPHPYGLCDILGNVWEWSWDWYKKYPAKLKRSPSVDPAGPDTSSKRVKRGGSCNYYARDVRAAYRNYDDPSGRDDYLGFRIVRSLSE